MDKKNEGKHLENTVHANAYRNAHQVSVPVSLEVTHEQNKALRTHSRALGSRWLITFGEGSKER